MFRERSLNGTVSEERGDDGVLRHPDGSINFDAYRAAAQRERRAALVSSIGGAASFARAISLALRARLAPVGKPEPACGKRH